MLNGGPILVSRIDQQQLPQVEFDDKLLPISDHLKNLEIHIDKINMSWGQQIQGASRRMFASARSFRKIRILRNFLPTATKIALAQSLVLPILVYAAASYLYLTEEQLDKLEHLQNFCIKFIFSLRKYDNVSEFRIKLNSKSSSQVYSHSYIVV